MTKAESCYKAFDEGLYPSDVCIRYPEIDQAVVRVYYQRWKEKQKRPPVKRRPGPQIRGDGGVVFDKYTKTDTIWR
jgi:hypothetical protein